MQFPVYITLGPFSLHPHLFFDLIAYSGGARLYFYLRRRHPAPTLPVEHTLTLLVGLLFGTILGAKLLAWAESPRLYWSLRHDPAVWTTGKTIVGGILGAWAGVECAKKLLGLRDSTGDLYVLPLLFGIAVGRIGCFLTGLSDMTHGLPTALPWGVDFGDGIPRHPMQLYESLFTSTLALLLWKFRTPAWPAGLQFRIAVGTYLLYRLTVEFCKPHPEQPWGLTAIQWACIVGVIICLQSSFRLLRANPLPEKNYA